MHKPNITNVIIFNSNYTKKFFFIFLQDILKFEEVGGAGFLELIIVFVIRLYVYLL